MKIVFTETALGELDEIFEYLLSNYPRLVGPVEERIQAVLLRLQQWLESAPKVTQRANVRVAPLIRFPYRIYYRIANEKIEIVHIRHTSRQPWEKER
jgi:toxin ParE1/3/4